MSGSIRSSKTRSTSPFTIRASPASPSAASSTRYPWSSSRSCRATWTPGSSSMTRIVRARLVGLLGVGRGDVRGMLSLAIELVAPSAARTRASRPNNSLWEYTLSASLVGADPVMTQIRQTRAVGRRCHGAAARPDAEVATPAPAAPPRRAAARLAMDGSRARGRGRRTDSRLWPRRICRLALGNNSRAPDTRHSRCRPLGSATERDAARVATRRPGEGQ